MKTTPLAKTLTRATAAIGATAAASQAATVQITLSGNILTNTSAMDFNNDITGDGLDDIGNGTSTGTNTVGLSIGGNSAGYAAFASSSFIATANGDNATGAVAQTISRLFPVTLMDARINGGAATDGFLDLTSTNISETEHTITLNRFIFDDENTAAPTGPFATPETEFVPAAIPEPSSLALLALGAGGLAARRRRRTAA